MTGTYVSGSIQQDNNPKSQLYVSFQASYPRSFGSSLANGAGQKISKQDEYALNFLNALVTAITGQAISSLPPTIRMQTVQNCVQVFSEYVINYTELKYGKSESIRLRASQKFQDVSLFQKFQELGGIFDEAMADFLQTMGRQWTV